MGFLCFESRRLFFSPIQHCDHIIISNYYYPLTRRGVRHRVRQWRTATSTEYVDRGKRAVRRALGRVFRNGDFGNGISDRKLRKRRNDYYDKTRYESNKHDTDIIITHTFIR